MKRTLEALTPLLDDAGNDAERFRRNIERWFDDGMDRVSGSYKRHTAYWQAAIAFVVAMLVNADALLIVRTLWREPTLRRSVVASAEAYDQHAAQAGTREGSTDPAVVKRNQAQRLSELQAEIDALGVPIGWSCDEHTIANWLWCAGRPGPARAAATSSASLTALSPRSEQGWLVMVFGWLIMAAAASLGAPFWFDTLKRFVSVRATGRVPAEGSAGRQQPAR